MKFYKGFEWFKLDNAAKIYPASHSRHWSNLFRLSATLYEDVDLKILNEALKNTIPRFPSLAARLSQGLFWYYLRPIETIPDILSECSYPLTYMSKEEMKKCAFRVIVYKNRIALELFHALTDGTGGLIFLKTLVAEYLELKHGISIPYERGVLSRKERPKHYETEDSFLKNSAPIKASRKDSDAWKIQGTPEEDEFLHITKFMLSPDKLLELAHERGVSLNTFLTAIMMRAIWKLQLDSIKNPKKYKPVKVLVPINLRPLFGSRTLRNFALYAIPEIDPRLGYYSIDELCELVHHKVGLMATPKSMAKMMETNVSDERVFALRIVPLFIKNFVMKMIFNAVGEKKSCLSFSNLGRIALPDIMQPYVQGIDFILGTQARAPYNCSCYTYNDILNITFTRNIKEAKLENYFYNELCELGISPTVQSNQR